MADKSDRDHYQQITIQGVSSLDNLTRKNIQVDAVSDGVLVHIVANDVSSSGGTSASDDADFTATTTAGTPAMGVYESTPTTVTDGDLGIVGITENRELKVSVTSGSTSGTQYTEGDTDASITGNAILWEDAADTLVTVSATKPLPVSASIDTTGLATDATDASVASIDSKTPALGQALAAASVPVVLPASQISTLTPQTDALTDTELRATPVPVSGSLTVDLGANNDVTVTSGSINATLAAETTKVIGTINVAAGQTIAVTNAGTFATQATLQAGTATIGKLGANSGVDIGDVDVTSCALPTGAATAAKQPALGTAGTASTDVITVQGIASMTALKVDGSAVTQPVSGTVTANATLAAETTKVIGTINVAAGQTIAVTNAGTFATQATLQTGSNAIGKLAANSGVDIGDVDVTSLPALAAGTNAIGKLLPPDIDVTAHTNYARKYYTASTPTDGIIWSPAAGKRWHVVTMYINVSAASTITLEDDKAGGDDPVWKGEIAANSGVVLKFDPMYPMASGEDAADLIITATAGTVYVTCVGYEV